jgi:hypothetical protein
MIGTACCRDYLKGKKVVRISARSTPKSGQILTFTAEDDKGERSRVSIRMTPHGEFICQRERLSKGTKQQQ